MKFGIRLRFALWLLAALLPAGIASFYVFDQIEEGVMERVASDLAGVRRLEAARIGNALDLYEDRGRNLAAGPHVRDFMGGVRQARSDGTQQSIIGGYDGFKQIDAFDDRPLQELAGALQRKTLSTTGEVAALQLVDLEGNVLGESAGFDWTPTDPGLIDAAISLQTTMVGDAFRDSEGEDRLGLVVPVVGADDMIVGALVLENELGPIVDLVVAHEGFGATSEAHIAQPTIDGDAEFITLLRFERDAAFTKTVPAEKNLPINQSLDAFGGRTIFAKDYRGEESVLAVETIERTGWGLVVKIDRAEILEPVLGQTRSLKLVAGVGVLGILLGWAALLDPVPRRLRKMAEAAARVSDGEYDRPLDDRSSDEIGAVARSIDRLATDLATDIAVRTDVEDRLRHQATHDATTGLFNRQHATGLMRKLSQPPVDAPFSLLFLDLDNFKSINDVYGHATGDAVLKVTAERLNDVVGDRGSVARWGGDEFVVVLEETSGGAAQDVAGDVQRAFETPVATSAGLHQVRASIGVSTLADGKSMEQLLHSADEAMFTEKQSRSGRHSVSPESVRAVERALDTDSVEVRFQPLVVDNGSNVMLRGAEALVRLRNEMGEIVEPAAFIRDVQRSHLGRDLDRRVFRLALRQVSEWIHAGLLPTDFQVSVNGCEALMRDADTVRFIDATLTEFQLAPHNLVLEISETSSTILPHTVSGLNRLGVKLAVDDVGRSNSNLDRLVDGGASIAKIDRRWLRSRTETEDEANLKVLRHLISLCDSLGLSVVAEGVETPDQFARMRSLGVTSFQGYLFARPLTGEEFGERFMSYSVPDPSALHNDL